VFLRMYETLLQTTAEDLMQLSQKYLTINNRTYVRVERPKVPQKSSDSREGKS